MKKNFSFKLKKCSKNIFIFTIIFLLGVITTLIIKKSHNSTMNVSCDIITKEEVINNIKKNFKDIENISIGDCVIPGLREITIIDTGEIFYTDLYGNYTVLGMLFNEKGENITKQKYDEIIKKQNENILNSIDKSIALKFGDGLKEVIEFTDVDCPFCIQAEKVFKEDIKDVTRYVYLTPIATLHPQAKKKSVHILCSENKEIEYEKVIKGEITEYRECEDGILMLDKHKEFADKLKLQGTPLFFYNGVKYSGLTDDLINKLKAE